MAFCRADLRNYSSYFKAFIDVLPVRRAPRRRAAASHKSDFEHHSQAEINKAYEERLLRMANKGVFGDNLEIQAFAREFQVNVKIYQRENAYVICPDNTMGPNPNGDTRTVHIAYHVSATFPIGCGMSPDVEQMWEHYSSIRNRDGPFSGPPCVRGQRAISDREKRKLLNGVTIILPWMEDIVSASIPHCESPERIREALQQCNGDVDEAAKLLQDEWYSSSNVDTDSTAPDDEEYYQSAEPSVMNEDLARMDDRQLTERIIKGDAGYEEEQVASLEIQSKTLIVAGKESMLIAQAHTQDVSLPIREPSSATVQNADNDGEYSGAKRRKSPDGSPIGVPATPINSSSDETSSAGSSGSSSDNTERRRRKPVKKSAIPALPTRRSTRIQALAKDAEKAAAAPPPPPKAPRARKPRAKTTTTPTTTSAKKKPVRKRGGAVIGIVTVGIRELYV